MIPNHEEWREATLKSRIGDFENARSYADRLALLREITRLNDGRFALASNSIVLSPLEIANLSRFGLARTGDGTHLRLIWDMLSEPLEVVGKMLPLDAKSRRVFSTAAPDAVLLRLSRHQQYQSSTQKAALRALLTAPPATALMVSMPTGSGKSLLFQVGALFWREENAGACAIVITPTVALAEDHERTLRTIHGLEQSRSLTGGMGRDEKTELLNAFRNGQIPILFISPEAAFGTEVQDILLEAAKSPDRKFGLNGRLVAVFVDEAHIVEHWGRTFRPDFQRLPALVSAFREHNPDLRTILLSATLGPAARAELRRSYVGVYGPGAWLEVHASTPRYEIDLASFEFDSKVDRHAALCRLIDLAPRPTIVYTSTVDDAVRLHDEMQSAGYERLALFTGKTERFARRAIVNGWAQNSFDLVVATSAFGLGVDKPDVRTVLHACLPENASRWYQEFGRAARDGHQGVALCLWTNDRAGKDSDESFAFGFVAGDWLGRDKIHARWRALKDKAEISWQGLKRRLLLNLDSAHQGLGRHTGARNRTWNQSLINMMQRAGALNVAVMSDPDGDKMICEVLLEWNDLIDDRTMDAALDRVLDSRNSEQADSVAAYDGFKKLMTRSGSTACTLTSVFRQIEPDILGIAPCGRCVHCRANGQAAPSILPPEGIDLTWAPLNQYGSSARQILIRPEDTGFREGLEKLVKRLVGAGVEQFVVSNEIVSNCLELVSKFGTKLGFVLSTDQWLGEGWALASLPTAFLVTVEDHTALLAVISGGGTTASIPETYVVADPRIEIAGRHLSQRFLEIYEEDHLDFLIIDKPKQVLS